MKMTNIAELRTHLSELLEEVEGGETLTICRRNRPIAEIRPLPKPSRKLRPFGLYKGKFRVPDDFNDPLPDEVLDLFEGR